MTCGLHRMSQAEAPERCPWCELSTLQAEIIILKKALLEAKITLQFIGATSTIKKIDNLLKLPLKEL